MPTLEPALLPCLFKDLPDAIREQYKGRDADITYVERNADIIVLKFKKGGAAYWQQEDDRMWRLLVGTRTVAS